MNMDRACPCGSMEAVATWQSWCIVDAPVLYHEPRLFVRHLFREMVIELKNTRNEGIIAHKVILNAGHRMGISKNTCNIEKSIAPRLFSIPTLT